MRLLASCFGLFLSLSAAADARFDYLLHCGGCHLANGRGAPPEIPTLRNELGKIVDSLAGRDYIARVPGSAQAPISDAALANVLNWILREFNAETLPKDFQPMSAEEVGRSRQNILADPLKHRQQLWPTGENEEY
ncbi:MAG: hypothetical protein AAF512_19025 [Pseudomonadota bacterium]